MQDTIQFVVTSYTLTDTEVTIGGEHPDHYMTEDGVHMNITVHLYFVYLLKEYIDTDEVL